MKHYVFIVDDYYPKFSGVSNCGKSIADELSKKNSVSIICKKSYFDQTDYECIKNQKIFRIQNEKNDKRNLILNLIKSSQGLKKRIYILKYYVIRIKSYLKAKFSKVNLDCLLIKDIFKQLVDINKNETVDIVIPLSLPMETVIAGLLFKQNNPNVLLIPFIFDKYANNISLQRGKIPMLLKKRKHELIEENILKKSTFVCIVNHMASYYTEKHFRYKSKIVVVEHPLVNLNLYCEKQRRDNSILLIYSGTLDKKNRNPVYFLKVIEKTKFMHPDLKISVKIFSQGNCKRLIEKFVKRTSVIENKDFVPKDVLMEEITNSNILILISNKDIAQTPSKVFEYISTGKPIVLFYYKDNDPCLQILMSYNLALFIKLDKKLLDENANNFYDFCINNYNKKVSKKSINQRFYFAMPSHYVNLLEKNLGKYYF